MNISELNQIEANIDRSKVFIDTGRSVERLKANKDFKAIVISGYFEQEAVRLVHLKGDPNMQSVASQESIVKQMDAISAFSQYLNTALVQASMAAKSLSSDEEMRDELLAEDIAV